MRNTPRMPRGQRGRSSRAIAAGLAAILSAGLLAACSSDDGGEGSGDTGGNGGDKDQITLTIGVFGQFGLEEAGLYDEYMAANPHIKIEQTSTQRSEDYWPALLTKLPTGSGLMDIQAVEVGNVYEAANDLSQYFVDLRDYEEVDTSHFLDWKVAQATSNADGKIVGLGTDIGPMGICYRKDLFADAGLPTDREEVGALWAGDWSAYVETGKEWQAATTSDAKWVDAGAGMFNAIVNSFSERYYNADGEVVYEDSEGVSAAWDTTMEAVEADLTAKHDLFSEEWNQGMANGDFATLSCPAWMLGYIEDKSGDEGKGQWDFAMAPQPANWGGSFLAVTEASKNKEEAVKLINWLTAPEQQAKLFTERGSYPSSTTAQEDPAVAAATHAYFSDAPIGELFKTAAEGIPTLITGPRDQVIQQGLSNGILVAEREGVDPDTAWSDTVKDINNKLDE
ncbi:ABC transporter substrate-binding protein [Streptomyces sp. YIM 98790]|uniref:ABC transporter substrate-binding protein n=1 Tax=Streptomyces sp. YIM 98790 TaxID=2689077 RepID=UPI001FB63CD7|nr:extracellular solute-binding protein [Streptomyces sp. YIM 98790]